MKLIIDIGASFYHCYGRKIAEDESIRVLAFEPNPTLFEYISNFIRQSEEIKDKIFLHKMAIVNDNTTPKVKLYIHNDECSSSLSPLCAHGVMEWKYPLGKSLFKTVNIIDIDAIKLEDYISSHPDRAIVNYKHIEILIIDIQDGLFELLSNISHKFFNRVKRIIVKCIITDFMLYERQSDIVDVIDVLRTRGFTLISTYDYSRNQEQYLEFANKRYVQEIEGTCIKPADGFFVLC